MWKTGLRLATGLSMLACLVQAPAASAAPFACPQATVFVAQNKPTQLFAQRHGAGGATFEAIGAPAAFTYNALAYNPVDGSLYAMNNTADPARLIQIQTNGSIVDLGTITGLPAGMEFLLGAFDDAGRFYIAPQMQAVAYVVDVTTRTATPLPIPAAPVGVDWAYIDGYLWAGRGAVLLRVHPTTGAMDTFPYPPGVSTTGPFGAAWAYGNGDLGISDNNTGDIYRIRITNGQSVAPTFKLVSTGSGPKSGNNDGAYCPGPPVDLSVAKSGPATVDPGTSVTWTITVTNNGPGVSSGMTVTDTLPAGLVSPSTSTPGCSIVGEEVQCVLGELAAHASQTISVTATMPTSFGTCLTNTATVVGNGVDPTPGNDQASAQTCTRPESADLSVTKSAPSPVVPGRNLTYTIVASNSGPDAAVNTRVTDQLPAGVSFVSASDSCSAAGTTVTCAAGTLAAGASQTFEVTVAVPASQQECPKNTATVTSDTADPDTTNNSATVCPSLKGRSNLSLTKTASRTTLEPSGGQVMYTIVVRNDGPSDNPDVQVIDALPAGLTLVSAQASQGSCATSGNTATCDLGRLRDGGSAQVLVTATAAGAGTCTTNTARVTGANEDPDADNNEASARVCVEAAPPTPPQPDPPVSAPATPVFDLAITKRAAVKRPFVGQQVTYRIVVRNNGPDAAPNVRLADTFNAESTLVSVRTPQGTCTRRLPLSCQLGTIASDKSVTVTVVLKPRDTGSARNAVSAIGEGTDRTPSNNLAHADINVRPVPLRVTKVASRTSVRGGDTLQYRIRVQNPTRGEARDVRVCDRLPSGLRFVSSQPRSARRGNQRCWTIKRLGARQQRTFTVTVRAAKGAHGRKTNTVTVTSPDGARSVRARADVRVTGAPTPVTG
jgi:uncharacterized repeat protein (TIGR01451 family)